MNLAKVIFSKTFLVTGFSALSLGLVVATAAEAKLTVLTTTTDLRSLVEVVAGDLVTVEAIAKGTQDPHFIEAKPSFMVKASKADLVVSVGLDLEVGWLPSILRGARNPKVAEGSDGYLEVGNSIDVLEAATGKVSRADGDVHPQGNPHFTLDPLRAVKAANVIAERLAKLDSANAVKYRENALNFGKGIDEKVKLWSARVAKSGVKKVISYHKTLTYFFDRFKLDNVAILEPKPGIPPTSAHILSVINLIREQKVPLILVENYFDPTVTRKIIQEVPEVVAHTVPVAVEGEPQIKNLEDLYEDLIKSVETSTENSVSKRKAG